MAKKRSTPGFQNALTRIQREGKRLAQRIERDLRRFVRRTRADLISDTKTLRQDVTTRIQKVAQHLDGRTTAVRRQLEKRLAVLEGAVRSRLHVAGSAQLGKLKQELVATNRRLDSLETRLAELAGTRKSAPSSGTDPSFLARGGDGQPSRP